MASATKVITRNTKRVRCYVKSGAAETIGINDVVIADSNNAGYVTIMGTGATEGDSDETFVGVAVSASTDTATADGYVDIVQPENAGWLELEMKAHTASNLARALVGTKVMSGAGTKGAQTIDENDTTKGVFKILDPHDNKFDTTGGRVRVALNVEPWGSSAIK